MYRHKRLDLNDALEFILDDRSDFDYIKDSDSDFEPDDSTTETVTSARTLGTERENQDNPQQQKFRESDEDNITIPKFKHKYS